MGVVLLILSWCYIAYSCLLFESSDNHSSRGIRSSSRCPRSGSQRDLELGEGPRRTTRVRKSRRSVNHLGDGTSARPTVRVSGAEEKLQITMNSVRGYRSQEDNIKTSSRTRHHRSARTTDKSLRPAGF